MGARTGSRRTATWSPPRRFVALAAPASARTPHVARDHHSAAAIQTVQLAAYAPDRCLPRQGLLDRKLTINADKLAHLTDKRYEVW